MSDVPATTADRRRSILDAIRDGNAKLIRDVPFEELAAVAAMTPDEMPEGERVPMDIAQTGEGFVVVPKAFKKYLVGVPLVIVDVDTNESKDRPGTYFTSVKLVTESPIHQIRPGCRTFILNDGSTGIHQQLRRMRLDGMATLPILCRRGLRVSEYTVTEDQTDPTTGEPVIDPETQKARKVPVLDPVTNQTIQGQTFYLDDSL